MADGMILRRGGGSDLAIRVMPGSVQPAGAAGMLWVETALAGNRWTAAVAEPDSPATGDLWIQMNATSGNIINLLKRNAAMINVLRVKQHNGTGWDARAAWYHNGAEWTQVSSAFTPATDIQYTGSMTLLDDGDGHWRIKLLTSGTLTFLSDPGTDLDVFCVGGGAGTPNVSNCGGGGSGYTTTAQSVAVSTATGYPVVVGAGGNATAGGTTSALGVTATGGSVPDGTNGGNGGCGGGDYGTGGAGGTNGGNGGNSGGTGQGSNTYEFGEEGSTLYCGGGGGAISSGTYNTGGSPGGGQGGGYSHGWGDPGVANTGGGAGGSLDGSATANGGSGIVVIRDHRAA